MFRTVLKSLIPKYNSKIYRLCKWYVNHFNGDNNSDIRSNGEYRVLKEFIPRSRIVFDVGTNVGDWAELALSINNNINLHCFEPSLFTFERLKQRFSRNVKCNNFGLSSSECERRLFIFEDWSGGNSLYPRHGLEAVGLKTQSKTELVKLTALDKYCKKYSINEIDFMKVDVEGHELEVFRGGGELIRAGRVTVMQFEYGGCNIDSRVLLKDIFEYFCSLPYQFFKIYPHHLRYISQYDQRLENFQYSNWLIVRKDIIAKQNNANILRG
jgi:FkbM family methyltransferase